MTAYEEQEDLERLKSWWKNYGNSVFFGILLGLAQYGFAPSATVTEYDDRGRMRTLKIRERTVPAPGIGTLGEFPRHYTITRDRDYGRDDDRRDGDDYGEDDD